MSRQPRMRSETRLYHITFRGINKQNIFEEDKDYQKLIELLVKIKQELEYKIYAYTFMPNHVHLFFQEKETGDSTIAMHKLLTSYAGWQTKSMQEATVSLEVDSPANRSRERNIFFLWSDISIKTQ